MEPPPKKRVCLSTEKKAEIVEFVERNPSVSQSAVGKKFGVPQSSVSTIIKQKDAIKERMLSGQKTVKKNRPTQKKHNCFVIITLDHYMRFFPVHLIWLAS